MTDKPSASLEVKRSGGIRTWFMNGLLSRRAKHDESMVQQGRFHTFSLARYRLHEKVVEAIESHAHGSCLDAGCGQAPYRGLMATKATSVVTFDVSNRGGADFIADIQDLHSIENNSFDTVFCSQVFEHIPRPWKGMSELSRILKPGGKLILTTPHLSAMHEKPHDYYRYTEFGLRALCLETGLEPLSTRPTGGLLTFLTHSVSWLLMSTLGNMPVLSIPVRMLNYVFLVRGMGLLDQMFGMASVFPCDIVLIAKKPGGEQDA